MNSFSYLERGIARELRRQAEMYDGGRGDRRPRRCTTTRRSDELTVLRSKELAHDYRYFPEPDLVPIEPSAELIERLRATRCPSCPPRACGASSAIYGLPFAAGARPRHRQRRSRTTSSRSRRARRSARRRQLGAERVLGAPQRGAREPGRLARRGPAALAALVGLVSDGTLGSAGAKQVFAALVAGESGGDPAAIVEARGLGQIADAGALAAVVAEVVAGAPRSRPSSSARARRP